MPMVQSNSPLTLNLTELAKAIARKEYSASDVLEHAIQRIKDYDSTLYAFCTTDFDSARKQAESVDQLISAGKFAGPLAGVPFAVKDLICTKGLRTTFGSQLYADFMPEEDDIVVKRLKAAGAVILGKTNTSEFGYGAVGHNKLFPTTRNPLEYGSHSWRIHTYPRITHWCLWHEAFLGPGASLSKLSG